MRLRTAASLAWTYWALTVGFMAAALVIEHLRGPWTFNDLFGNVVPLAFACVGLLVASRRPENLTGWVLAVGTLLMVAGGFLIDYSIYGLVTAPGSLPIPIWAAMFGGWFRSTSFILMVYVVLLLFPDGKLPSPRWRGAAWLLVVSWAVQTLDSFFSSDLSDIDFSLAPFSKPTANIFPAFMSGVFGGLTILCWGVSVLACVGAIVVRFRRSRGDERQQLKWLTYSALLSGLVLMLIYLSVTLNLSIVYDFGGLLFDLALAPIPVAVGIAVLKYRLYDIDIIIRRTLVYSILTALLALTYWGGVVGLQALLRPITGQGNDLAIVATTLLVAALVLPLRRAIQSFIDRRFYRRKYDAARTLQAFSEHLRDEVELGKLAGRLVSVVEETMQPEHISLWLRAADSGKSGGEKPGLKAEL